MRHWISGILLGLVIASVHADLPPEVQADLLQRKIQSALKAKDLDEAAALISEYRSLGVEMAPTLFLVEAKVLASRARYSAVNGQNYLTHLAVNILDPPLSYSQSS